MTESVPPLHEQIRAARGRKRQSAPRPEPPNFRRAVLDGVWTTVAGLLLLFVNSFWPGLNPPERVNWPYVLTRLPLSALLMVGLLILGAALGWATRITWWTIRRRDRRA